MHGGGGYNLVATIERGIQQRGNHNDECADDGNWRYATPDDHSWLDATDVWRGGDEKINRFGLRMEAPSGLEPEPQV